MRKIGFVYGQYVIVYQSAVNTFLYYNIHNIFLLSFSVKFDINLPRRKEIVR